MRSCATFDGAMRTSLCAALSLLLVACTGAPPPHLQHPFVGRFADALAFVPQGMDRLMLTDCSAREPESASTSKKLLEVECGRPTKASGPILYALRQWFEGITIADYGAAGVPSEEFEALGELQGTIAGRPLRVRGERPIGVGQTTPPTWSTLVDDRFLVVANSEALLQAALSRPHGDIAATLVREAKVPADAGWVVFREDRATWFWTIADRTRTRFELCWPAGTGPLNEHLESSDSDRVEDLGQRGSSHRWRCIATPESALRHILALHSMLLFGYFIFI